VSDRAKRRDAVANRELLVASAREVFARRGLSATLDDVAHHAGLGVGTAYRHFPNKQALAAEALRAAVDELIADAERAIEEPEPWAALTGFFETVVSRQQRDRGLHHVMLAGGILDDEPRARFAAAIARLFDRARAAGAIRAEASATDVGPILVMMRTVIDLSAEVSPELWRRYLAMLLDGLQATDRPALAQPALADRQFEPAMDAAARAFNPMSM
jgi:AcrR family transcriptional regulator